MFLILSQVQSKNNTFGDDYAIKKVFISYANKDAHWKNELQDHLGILNAT